MSESQYQKQLRKHIELACSNAMMAMQPKVTKFMLSTPMIDETIEAITKLNLDTLPKKEHQPKFDRTNGRYYDMKYGYKQAINEARAAFGSGE